MTESSTTQLPAASPETTTAPDIATTQDVSFACTECGAEYALTKAAVEHWVEWESKRREALGRTAMIRSTLASRPSGWVLIDEHEQDVLICPACVARLKPAKAAETCPSWCVTDHVSEKLVNEWCFQHTAPVTESEDFSIVRWSNSDQLEVQVSLSAQIASKPEHDECAAELRKFARAAEAAAEWLETNAPASQET